MLVEIELLPRGWPHGLPSMPKNLKKVQIYPNLVITLLEVNSLTLHNLHYIMLALCKAARPAQIKEKIEILCSTIYQLGSNCLLRLACLWNKMPMFQRAGMRWGGLPLSQAFQYSVHMTWIISLPVLKCQDYTYLLINLEVFNFNM
jgi:hypothetical protein